jgi:glycosyltransferase involved in cell wall biosynthesis
MPSSPSISVLIPAYNAAAFIRETIDSILQQTESNFELILINDGSTDETHEIALELCNSDSRIRYFAQENQGIVATLNRGLELCRGEFIARMDADDIARIDRLQKQVALLKANPDVIICGSEADLLGPMKKKRKIWVPGTNYACRAVLPLSPCFIHPSVMFRRTAIDQGARYNSAFQYAEDYEFWHQLQAFGQLRNIKESLLEYRLHDGQLSQTKQNIQMETHLKISVAQLTKLGISVPKESLRAILWPQERKQPKSYVLASAIRLFLLMAIRGRVNLYQMLRTLALIIRTRS